MDCGGYGGWRDYFWRDVTKQWAAVRRGGQVLFLCDFAVQSCVFKTYTLPDVLHCLERGMLCCRWGVCWPV